VRCTLIDSRLFGKKEKETIMPTGSFAPLRCAQDDNRLMEGRGKKKRGTTMTTGSFVPLRCTQDDSCIMEGRGKKEKRNTSSFPLLTSDIIPLTWDWGFGIGNGTGLWHSGSLNTTTRDLLPAKGSKATCTSLQYPFASMPGMQHITNSII
jgi:hypothetical protein